MTKKLKRKIKMKIKYHWTCDQGIDIPEKHHEALFEEAESRIFDQSKEGYSSGELYTSVRHGKDIVPEEDEEEGLSYSGYFTTKINLK
jgi:hypothetical protein